MSPIPIKFWEKVSDSGEPLANYLPYFIFDPDHNVYTLADGSLGVIYVLKPVPDTLLTAQEQEGVLGALERAINDFPEGLAYQFIYYSIKDIEESLQSFCQMAATGNGLSKFIIDSRVEWYRKGTEGFFDDRRYFAHTTGLLFTLRTFPSWKEKTGIAGLKKLFQKNIKAAKQSSYQQEIYRLRQIAEATRESLSQAGLHPHEAAPQRLINILYRFFNPRRKDHLPPPAYQPGLPIREQILFNSPIVTPYGFTLEGHHQRVLSLKILPEQVYPGMLNHIRAIPAEYLLAFNFYAASKAMEERVLKIKRGLAFTQRFNIMGDVSLESKVLKEELDTVLEKTYSQGKRIMYGTLHMTLLEDSEARAEELAYAAQRAFSQGGLECAVEDIIGASVFLRCLPLNFDPSREKYIRRQRRIVSDVLPYFCPALGSWTGMSQPGHLYLNRQGNPVPFDLFIKGTVPHAVIAAATGSGKSFFVNDLLMQAMRFEPYIFILDIGGSYRKLCQVFSGQYFDIDLNNTVMINPFSGPFDRDKLSSLNVLLMKMVTGADPYERVSREEAVVLEKAIIDAYGATGDSETVTLSGVVDALKKDEHGESGKKLARELFPFTRNGKYGMFFDHDRSIEIRPGITVFDLTGLKNYPDLQVVMLLTVMSLITDIVQQPQVREQRKYLVIEEAWALLKDEASAGFIETAYRTYRKCNCAAISITQVVSDFATISSGRVILFNAPKRILLQHEKDAAELARKELNLSEAEYNALLSLTTVSGKYSEALVKTEQGGDVIRLVPDPVTYWLATTDPNDWAILEREVEKAEGNIIKAINVLVSKND